MTSIYLIILYVIITIVLQLLVRFFDAIFCIGLDDFMIFFIAFAWPISIVTMLAFIILVSLPRILFNWLKRRMH